MEDGLRLQTRREFLQKVIPQYREASTVKRKSKLLDAFTATTGYNRKYSIWLLNHGQEKRWSDMSISTSLRSAAGNCSR